jgi:hypothetical protein
MKFLLWGPLAMSRYSVSKKAGESDGEKMALNTIAYRRD